MLMDEPFGALDPVTRDELGRAYRALHERLGLTTIMVTHDMAEALVARRPGRGADRRPHPRRRDARAPWSPARATRTVQALIDVPRRQAQALARLTP